jgi:hypothetical protein
LENFGNCTFKKASADITDHIGENVVIECSIDLLHDDPFDKVAGVERLKCFVENCSFSSNDGDGGACQIG